MKIKNLWAFTLIEILVWILIVSFIVIGWFQALTTIWIWKVRLIQQTDIQKQSFYFTEKLFEMIKKWGTLDYEEYFNRKVVWNTSYSSGHYDLPTWFGNFWAWWNLWTTTYWSNFYVCRSWNGVNIMWTWWCVTVSNTWSLWGDGDYTWDPQRYGQYSFQFIDYNSNANNDWWDEDSINGIIWDDDDEYLWEWPVVFTWGTNIHELYLLSWNKKTRTLFRWNVKDDPEYPGNPWGCNYWVWSAPTWTWCLWTIEYLLLQWKDWWMDHNILSNDGNGTQYDWVYDTWIIDNDFSDSLDTIASSGTGNYWVSLFPDSIHVSDFKIFAYPNIDRDLAWKDATPSTNISPYIRLQIWLLPSWKSRKQIKGNPKELRFSTTISLTDIFSH